ncbi:FAD-dependent oxidoreductase [Marispirochaeta aestuarii]|uniref:FAD-dependent oxidoreductase n=1 Tax=Marispirochaeta aestuarii TaxID=1963862 RepID=UPI0029C70656|nr:FAD-dependent oxidoreductase [Marispirochaeta aestuarii]
MKKIVRKRTAFVMAVLVSVMLIASCSQGQEAKEAVSLGKPDITADVVVVGAGGAGLTAAIQASQLGLDVILLEKNSYPGGTTIMTEGMFAVGSHYQKEAGVDIDQVDLLRQVQEYNHWLSNSIILQKLFKASAGTIDWLEDLGVEFTEVSFMGDSVQTWHLFEGMGEGYINSMHKAALAAGVNLMLETPGKELVMEDGKVKGLIAEDKDGERISIEAPVVILATGGYSDNPEMMEKHVGVSPEHSVQIGMPGRTGDGIKMGLGAGADTFYLGTAMFYGGNLKGIPYGNHLYTASAFQPTMIWVNQDGKRFADESIAGLNFSFSGNAIKNQRRVFSILNKENLDYFVEEGCILGTGGYTLTGTKLTELYDQIDEQLEKGNEGIQIADTLEELSSKIDVDTETLKTTLANYNSYCDKGADEGFGKKAEYLQPMTSGPWYSFELAVGYFTTVGGLKVNENAQVLTTEDAVIPGLYATGTDAGGLYGDSYDVVICAGSCQGWAVNSGRFAAQDAARYLGK